MAGQRELLNLRRAKLARGISPPSGHSEGAGNYRRAGQDGTAPGGAPPTPAETGWNGCAAWNKEDFAEVGRRLRELERQRRAAFGGLRPVREEMDCFRIYFDSNDAEVCGQRGVLDRAARAISEAGAVAVVVTGHTDRHGTYDQNMDLGIVRAMAVKYLLVVRGVPQYRIECRSAGFTDPRLSADPMAESADIMNRRVEIHIRN